MIGAYIFVGFVSGLLVAVLARLADMWREKRAIPRYRNKKNGDIYEWIAMATDVTNHRQPPTTVVVYRKDGKWFVREYWEFAIKFESEAK